MMGLAKMRAPASGPDLSVGKGDVRFGKTRFQIDHPWHPDEALDRQVNIDVTPAKQPPGAVVYDASSR